MAPLMAARSNSCPAFRRPILSSRFSAIQGVKWPNLVKILDNAEQIILGVSSGYCVFGTWTENPRVGSSILSLTTIKQLAASHGPCSPPDESGRCFT
ncbi:MAG: hypothetical protein WCB10_03285, partial [Steroidobacteraceae bacterium]